MGANRTVVWLERTLVIVGVVCLGWYGYVSIEAASFQRAQAAAFERLKHDSATPAVAPTARDGAVGRSASTASPVEDALVGMLEIPRLGLTTPVITGDDDRTLEIAAGHLQDTPRPWEPGNSAIAGHRDGLFRPLKNIRVGDVVRMRTTRGDRSYRVRDVKIVRPDDLSVLKPSTVDTLTLITCYPFDFVGSAPKRFIVRAERIE